jgi:hypothetical protein
LLFYCVDFAILALMPKKRNQLMHMMILAIARRLAMRGEE